MDTANLRAWFETLPVDRIPAGTMIMAAGETSGRIMILKEGAVEVAREGVAIAEVDDPGAIFGELSILLKRAHTADVRTTRPSTFRIVAGERLFEEGPDAALYVATALAQRLDRANDRLLEIQRKLESEQHPPGAIAKMIETIGDSLRFGPPI
jgi:CRP/FNR family cyclic AMP-dependent transcriptional regulator